MARDFDTINNIFSKLSEYQYNLTKAAADEFYAFGDRSLLNIVAKQTGLTPEEILAWW